MVVRYTGIRPDRPRPFSASDVALHRSIAFRLVVSGAKRRGMDDSVIAAIVLNNTDENGRIDIDQLSTDLKGDENENAEV